jgi:hypothetical protein
LAFFLSMAGQPTDLVFLGASPFRFGNPAFEPWILLDFLGFSRANRDFSMSYAGESANDFSGAL